MTELTDADIEWEKIENPEPGGPYWQPVNPYARYFWRELIDHIQAEKRDREYREKVQKQLGEYFKERLGN